MSSKTKKENKENKESKDINPLPYVIGISIQIIIIMILFTIMIDYYFKMNYCSQNPDMWCSDLFKCQNQCQYTDNGTSKVCSSNSTPNYQQAGGLAGPVNNCFCDKSEGLYSCLLDSLSICKNDPNVPPDTLKTCDCTIKPPTGQGDQSQYNCYTACPLETSDMNNLVKNLKTGCCTGNGNNPQNGGASWCQFNSKNLGPYGGTPAT